jgi:hypothetical protein
MLMLGTVLMNLTRMATWLKTRFNAMILTPLLQLWTTGVSAINQAIQSVKTTLLAWTKQNKEQLLAQSHLLLVSLMKVGSILVILTVGLIGLLAHLIVNLYHLLVSKLLKKGQ